jgi:PelA/Pel-15E family pectate lyase
MRLPNPSPPIAAAIGDAIAWFERVALEDVAWDRRAGAGSGLLPTPGSPRLWARLYEIDTDRPVFGDRDRTIHFVVSELSSERRLGYAWYGDWPETTLAQYREWRARVAERSGPSKSRP